MFHEEPLDRRRFLQQAGQYGTGLMIGLPLLSQPLVRVVAADQPQAGSDSQAWFADNPFNLLVDYYTEVPFRPYGSGATRENVLKVLQDLRPGYIIIYAKGHSGRTTFPSSLKTEHELLAKDMPAFFREVTRETGTKLFLYYSGLLDGIAGTRHPEWASRGKLANRSSTSASLATCSRPTPCAPGARTGTIGWRSTSGNC